MEGWQLAQMQSLSLEEKVIKTALRIREWINHWDGQVYLSFSGGKDSTVLRDIVMEVDKSIPSVFVDTGLEYPEVREHVNSIGDVVTHRPKMPFNKVIEAYGYPVVSKEQAQYIYEARTTKSENLRNLRLYGRNGTNIGKISNKWKFLLDAPFKISHKCCNVMKKQPVYMYERETGRKCITGTMACESSLRKLQYLKKGGCNAFNEGRPISSPMGFWTEQDILMYLKIKKIKIPSVYGDIVETETGLALTGLPRTGCMFCLFGVHADNINGKNRFQVMRETHPYQYNYCMNQLGIGDVLDYLSLPKN